MDISCASLRRADAHRSYDEELAPPPLRILKRTHQRDSSASSGCLPLVDSDQKSSLSTRQPSVLPGHTRADLSCRNGSPSRSSAIEDPLNVRKHRRSDPVHAHSGASSTAAGKMSGVTLSYPPARPRLQGEHDFAPSMRNLNVKLVDSKPNPWADHVQERSVTVSSTRDAGLLNTFPGGLSLPLALSPSVARGRRRAVTAVESRHSLAKLQDLEITLEQEIVRRPSTKQRFISRVMSSFNNKTKVSYGATQPGERLHVLHKALPNIRDTSNTPLPVRSRSDTVSSIGTGSVLGGEFDTVISAFPPPPSSNLTSPTTLTSSETSRVDRATTFRKPENIPVVGAELSMTPELSMLGSDGGQSMYVAVEIRGAVSPHGPCEAPFNPQRLDVALIIDNSLFASPATLMANCETARFLASLLDPTTDRLAIITTMPVNIDISNPNVISPLSEATIRNTKSKVDTIAGSIEKPDPEALSTTIALAKRILTESRYSKPDNGPKQSALRHIFVLSSRVDGSSRKVLRDYNTQIHLICPGSVPWRISENTECNGWKLRPYYTDELQILTYNKRDMDATSLFNRLRGLISRARRGTSVGATTDLVLDVKAGPECSVEGVMGRREISVLHPGEVINALVKLRVGAPSAKGYSLAPFQNSPRTRSSPHQLTDEIDGLLGTSAITVLTATLRYKHSLLPAGTTCTVTAESRLKREDPSSSRSRSKHNPFKLQSPKVAKSQISVQKRLVFHFATYHSPRHAMSTLTREFGQGGCRSVCPEYIKLVNEELKYQARIIDRFDLMITGTGFGGKTPQSTFEHFGQGLFDISNYKPQDWLTVAPDEENSSSSVERRSRRHALVRYRPSKQKENEARRIAGRAKRMVEGRHYAGVRIEGEQERRIREEAWRSKRNDGTDTLRSFSDRERLGGAFAPWV